LEVGENGAGGESGEAEPEEGGGSLSFTAALLAVRGAVCNDVVAGIRLYVC